MNLAGDAPQLSRTAFQAIRELLLSVAGISLTSDKEELVKSRLASRLRELKFSDYEGYLQRIETDRSELSNMIDVLTTNKTSFFREQHHFDFLCEKIFPRWREDRRPRQIWSAGCSSGEEPYSLAMLLREQLPSYDVRILATDLSRRVLMKARQGRYEADAIASIPANLQTKYLRKARGEAASFQIAPEAMSLVSFARLNLMGNWSMRNQFDLILCRNVMIYFQDDTRTALVRRFAEKLAPGAYLFIGHAESLSALQQPLHGIEPAIYAR